MAVPKYRTSRSKRGSRRSHHALERPAMHKCEKTGLMTFPHRQSIYSFQRGKIAEILQRS